MSIVRAARLSPCPTLAACSAAKRSEHPPFCLSKQKRGIFNFFITLKFILRGTTTRPLAGTTRMGRFTLKTRIRGTLDQNLAKGYSTCSVSTNCGYTAALCHTDITESAQEARQLCAIFLSENEEDIPIEYLPGHELQVASICVSSMK
jgi:hypothetical protein